MHRRIDPAYAGTTTPATTVADTNTTVNRLLNYTESAETSILNAPKTTGLKTVNQPDDIEKYLRKKIWYAPIH